MTSDGLVKHYDEGERTCPICGEALPAHSTWPGARYRFCNRPECTEKVKHLKGGRYFAENTQKCKGPNCTNFVPEGRYSANCKFIACSPECYRLRLAQGGIVLTCDCGCERTFHRASHDHSKSGLVFLSPRHQGDYLIEKTLKESCGRFRPIADEYLDGVARQHYSELRGVRRSLATLFLFLQETDISSLEEVSPRTITDYILWMKKNDRKLATSTLSCISTFFNWMIDEGRRKAANPVTRWHRRPRQKRKPRPLKPHELELMWDVLIERGTPKIRLAAALGLEAGLRNGEICRLQVSDVDLERQRLLVRLPNKGKRERNAFFGPNTIRYWHEWMKERDPNCSHGHVLYNEIGTPYSPDSLADAFKRVLCKEHEGKTNHETGFDKWSTHRLRHTMATTLAAGGADLVTQMAAGGWLDVDTMSGYVEVSDEQARRGYDEAMRKFHEQKDLAPATRIVTPDELLAIWAAEDEAETPVVADQQRCV